MSRKPKVSVLIAAFNAEKFLGKAVESLKQQTMADFEAFIIDDASTDGTLALAQSCQASDPRFKAIALEKNQGQAVARNIALKEAAGTFTCFLDADDWLSPDALQQAVKTFDDHPLTDCVLFRVVMEQDGRATDYPMKPFSVLTGEEAFSLSLKWQIHGVYITRTTIHKAHPYDTTTRAYSDDNTTRVHYLLSREVRSCKGEYHYLQHSESTTHAITMKRFDVMAANASMRRQMQQLGVARRIIDSYETERWLNLVDCCCVLYHNRESFSAQERSRAKSEIERWWNDIDFSKVERRHRCKLGYAHLPSFPLFWLQERFYFWLRSFLFNR